jgi:hypothetical protein
MKDTSRKRTFATTLGLLFIGGSGLALSGLSNAAEDEGSTTQASEEEKKPGFTTDSFEILPELQLSAYYDDNIYATPRQEVSDYVGVFTPILKVKSLWEENSLNFDAGASLGRYADHSGENYNDAWVTMDGSFSVGDNTSLFGGAGYSHKHEPRGSLESDRLAAEPTVYNVTDLRLGMRQGYEALTLRVAGTYQALAYDNVERVDNLGTIYNGDRDRTVTGLGARASKRLDKSLSIYLQAFVNKRDYDDTEDVLGYDRDSKGYTASLGVTKKFGRNGKIDAYLGWLSQEYEDDRFDRVNTPNYAASLRWYPAKSYKLTASLNRTLGETTEVGSSGYLYTQFDTQLDKRISNNIVGYLNYGYGLVQYQDVNHDDVLNTVGLGLNYYMTKRILISGGYSYINNDSNIEFYEYTKNLLLVSLKAKF